MKNLRPRALKILANNWLKGQLWFHPAYRHIRKQRLAQAHIDWTKIAHRTKNAAPQQSAIKILFATSTGAQLPASYMEQTLGVALSQRGADVSFLLCDGVLPACMLCESALMKNRDDFLIDGPKRLLCEACFAPAAAAVQPLGLPLQRYSEYITHEDHKNISAAVDALNVLEIKAFTAADVPLGEQAFAGACRYFGSADPLIMPKGEAVLRQYLHAAWLAMLMAERILTQQKPDVVVLHHGIYVPQGIIAAVAKKQGIRVVTWHPAYRKNTFIFSHDDTYHQTMITEDTQTWEAMAWDDTKRERIQDYLKSRQTGAGDWIWFHEKPSTDQQQMIATLKLDMQKPTIGLLTNVAWDAQLHYPNNAYPDMFSWIFDTVDYFLTRPDMQLIIRIHPAEIYGNVLSRQTTEAALYARYGKLPKHIKIIPPLSELSTYTAMSLCANVLIYSTKTGIELAAVGKPVVVCGDSWLRGKNLAHDVSSPAEYQQVLRELPLADDAAKANIERALRYAYHFFFRRMLEVSAFKPQAGWPPYSLAISNAHALDAGQCKGLDVICEGILRGSAFIASE